MTYNATTELFWTTTESELTKDAAAAKSYVFGAPALAALDDGRIIVLEREVYVPNGDYSDLYNNSFTRTNLYVVNPGSDSSGILRKTLLTSFTTKPSLFTPTFANYEGMCVGPTLPDGSKTLVLIPDSQGGYSAYGYTLLKELVKVITFK